MGDLLNVFSRHKGVLAVMLMNRQGILCILCGPFIVLDIEAESWLLMFHVHYFLSGLIIKSTNAERGLSGFYCGLAKQILDRMVAPIEDVNSSKIQVIRIASGIQELLISPGTELILSIHASI
jgi:hypothetical protein